MGIKLIDSQYQYLYVVRLKNIYIGLIEYLMAASDKLKFSFRNETDIGKIYLETAYIEKKLRMQM